MRGILGLFKIRKQERGVSLVILIILFFLNFLLINNSFRNFIHLKPGNWHSVIKNFTVSGFDPITYYIVTDWSCTYNVYRHPLLAFFVWPLSKLDYFFQHFLGINLVQFIVAAFLILFAFYTFIFLLRIFTDIVKIKFFDSALLSFLFFSFAYVMLSVAVPDHFCCSMFLLVFSLYISGRFIQKKKLFGLWQTALMAIITSGVTLTNGVKIFIYALFTNGKSFFRVKYLLFAVIIPSCLIWGFAKWEYKTYVWPNEVKRKANQVKADSIREHRAYLLWRDTVKISDSSSLKASWEKEWDFRVQAKKIRNQKKAENSHKGKPISQGEFLRWSDVTTSRFETLKENFFGESIQLHSKHILQDTLRSRPVIVYYSWWINYIVEIVIVLLFILGIFFGRTSRFFLMALSGFLFDVALHLGLGFAINEVYIMGAHWLFVIPIAIAFIFKAIKKRKLHLFLRSILVVLLIWLWAWNGTLIAGYFL